MSREACFLVLQLQSWNYSLADFSEILNLLTQYKRLYALRASNT